MTPLWEAYIFVGDSLCCLDAISNQLESTNPPISESFRKPRGGESGVSSDLSKVGQHTFGQAIGVGGNNDTF